MTKMTELQKQIAEKKAKLAIYKENKGRYSKYPGEGRWWYYTVKRLEDELKELLDTVPCSVELDNEWANESI